MRNWVSTICLFGLLITAIFVVGCVTPKSAQRGESIAEREDEEQEGELKIRTVQEVKIEYVDDVTRKAQDLFQEALVLVYTSEATDTSEILRKRYKEALEIFEDAISDDPGFLEAYFNLGMTYERLQMKDKALESYNRALTNNPDSQDAQAYLGKIYLAKARDLREAGNDYEADSLTNKAKTLLDTVLLRDEDNVPANNSMALYWLADNNLEKADDFVRRVLNVDPNNIAALNTRGLINYVQKEYKLARWIFEEKVMRIEKNSTEAWTNLGLTYLALGKKPEGVLSFERAIQLDPENVPSRLNLAAIYLDYLDYAKARDMYLKVLERHENHVEALIGLGTAYWGLGQHDETVANYEKVLTLSSRYNELLRRLGDLYETSLGDNDKAVAYFKRYIAVEQLPETNMLVQKVKILEDSDFGEIKMPDDDDDLENFEDDIDGPDEETDESKDEAEEDGKEPAPAPKADASAEDGTTTEEGNASTEAEPPAAKPEDSPPAGDEGTPETDEEKENASEQSVAPEPGQDSGNTDEE